MNDLALWAPCDVLTLIHEYRIRHPPLLASIPAQLSNPGGLELSSLTHSTSSFFSPVSFPAVSSCRPAEVSPSALAQTNPQPRRQPPPCSKVAFPESTSKRARCTEQPAKASNRSKLRNPLGHSVTGLNSNNMGPNSALKTPTN